MFGVDGIAVLATELLRVVLEVAAFVLVPPTPIAALIGKVLLLVEGGTFPLILCLAI